MKYKYEIKEWAYDDETSMLIIEVPEEIGLVMSVLFSDVQEGKDSAQWYFEVLDKVLNGESEYEEFTGNVCCLEIKKDYTKIVDILDEDDEVEPCIIETKELREFIEIWSAEQEKFRNKNK